MDRHLFAFRACSDHVEAGFALVAGMSISSHCGSESHRSKWCQPPQGAFIVASSRRQFRGPNLQIRPVFPQLGVASTRHFTSSWAELCKRTQRFGQKMSKPPHWSHRTTQPLVALETAQKLQDEISLGRCLPFKGVWGGSD
eukprot:56101-Amphidinium_carterae.1